MNKMREAFEKWYAKQTPPVGIISERDWCAGYQAAIADVKAGGPYIMIPSDVAIGTSITLYKLPEDV